VANRLGLQEAIPRKPLAADVVAVREAAVVIRRAGRLLLVQRPATGRWAGMWEFPHGELLPRESPPTAAARLARQLTGLEVASASELTTVRHRVTRFQITMVACTAAYRSGRFRSDGYAQGRWVGPDELAQYPISTPQRRVAAAATRPTGEA
jgi:A/G-specific adenine glycosylase